MFVAVASCATAVEARETSLLVHLADFLCVHRACDSTCDRMANSWSLAFLVAP